MVINTHFHFPNPKSSPSMCHSVLNPAKVIPFFLEASEQSLARESFLGFLGGGGKEGKWVVSEWVDGWVWFGLTATVG